MTKIEAGAGTAHPQRSETQQGTQRPPAARTTEPQHQNPVMDFYRFCKYNLHKKLPFMTDYMQQFQQAESALKLPPPASSSAAQVGPTSGRPRANSLPKNAVSKPFFSSKTQKP